MQAQFGVTYDEVLRLPANTRVLLKDGKVGHIVSWYHTAEAVAVEVGPERRILHARDFTPGADGIVVEGPQDPTVDPGHPVTGTPPIDGPGPRPRGRPH